MNKYIEYAKTFINWIRKKIVYDNTQQAGDGSQLAAGDWSQPVAGNRSKLAAGNWSQLTAGDESQLAAGDWSKLATGDESQLATGDESQLAAGDESQLAAGDGSKLAAGYGSQLAAGDRSKLAAGYESQLVAGIWSQLEVGERGIAMGDHGSKAKGKLGSAIVLCEREEYPSRNIRHIKAGIIDGKKLKPDTWYKLKDGEFTEITI